MKGLLTWSPSSFPVLGASCPEMKTSSFLQAQTEVLCTHIGVAQFVLPIGPDAGDCCRSQRLGKGLSCPLGPGTTVTAQFRAAEETWSCRIALIMSQRQLVDRGLRSRQSRTGATVTLVERSIVGELVGWWAVALPRSRCLLGPGMPG